MKTDSQNLGKINIESE